MTALYRKNLVFYPVVFGAWAALLLAVHSGHQYHGLPLMSAGFEKTKEGMSKIALLHNSITELQKNYIDEKNEAEKPHILQNIGCAYFDLCRETSDRSLLDSALFYTHQSTVKGPPNARFFYNLGRIFTERGDHEHALEQYNLALRQDSTHILALSNAGTCSYFAFGNRKESAKYFNRALAVDSQLPMCHLVLGLIEMDEKDSLAAIGDFEKELRADGLSLKKNPYPLQLNNISYAASIAHRNLFMLYSTSVPDRSKAEEHLRQYLALEPEQGKREMAEKEMKRFWAGRR